MNAGFHQARSRAVLAAVLFAGCSQSPTAPTATGQAVKENGAGVVAAMAAGDVKNGPIEIGLVRVAQGDGGVAAFYANAGGSYAVRPNVTTEIYIQTFTSDAPVTNPRLVVDWGDGIRDNISCGGCRLSHTYSRANLFTVTVIMDDRNGFAQSSRTFALNAGAEVTDSGFGTFSGSLSASDPTFNIGQCGEGSTSLPTFFYDTYTIHHPGGHLHLETTSGSCQDTMIALYSSFNPASPCNYVAFNDDNSSAACNFFSTVDGTFPAGDYVVVVTEYDNGDLFNYGLTISK